MTGWMLAALQGMGEYGALTSGTAGGTAAMSQAAQMTMWVSDHRTAVIVGAVVVGAFFWWFSSPRT